MPLSETDLEFGSKLPGNLSRQGNMTVTEVTATMKMDTEVVQTKLREHSPLGYHNDV